MTLAPWRSPLARALHRNRSRRESRYFQLATVRADGRPANRTVVFRGFYEDSNVLQVITDRRSAKYDQLDHQPWGEICWYFAKTREQFRILGTVVVIDHDTTAAVQQEARSQVWHKLSDAARSQFAWPYPGQARSPHSPEFDVPPPDPTAPLPTFCLVLLDPIQVDHLELQGDPQTRSRYCWHDQHWHEESVNP